MRRDKGFALSEMRGAVPCSFPCFVLGWVGWLVVFPALERDPFRIPDKSIFSCGLGTCVPANFQL